MASGGFSNGFGDWFKPVRQRPSCGSLDEECLHTYWAICPQACKSKEKLQTRRASCVAAGVVISPIFDRVGIPTELLEASAAGKALVTTSYCEKAVGGGTPFVVPKGPVKWAEAIAEFFKTDSAAKLGEENLKFVNDRFGLKAWEKGMEAIESRLGS